MPEEQIISKELELLKKHIKSKVLIIGLDRTMKLLRQGKLSKVFMAANVAKLVEDDLNYYSKLSGVELVKLDLQNDELGVFCKKPFSISLLGLLR